MQLPKFEDVHPNFSPTDTYRVTNEEPELFREMLRKKRFRRVAGIASAGEVPLFVLLPHAEEVVAIDHAYGSLAPAYAKTLLFSKLGVDGIRTLLLDKTYNAFTKAITEVIPKMPAVLQSNFNAGTISSGDWAAIRREWAITPVWMMRRAHAKIRHLTYIHGDLTDLIPRGPFEALYVSNAFEKTDRRGGYVTAKAVLDALTPDGLLLTSSVYGGITADWKQVRAIPHIRNTSWTYSCYQRVKAAAAAAAVGTSTQATV